MKIKSAKILLVDIIYNNLLPILKIIDFLLTMLYSECCDNSAQRSAFAVASKWYIYLLSFWTNYFCM